MVQKLPLNFGLKDFLDKNILIHDDGVLYYYYSSLPKDISEVEKAPLPKGERAFNFQALQTFSRRESDNKIVYKFLVQSDFKINITPVLTKMFVPSGILDFANRLNRYLNDNIDNFK